MHSLSARSSRLTKPIQPLAAAALAILLGVSAPAAAQNGASDEIAVANKRCMDCHGRKQIATHGPVERRAMVAPIPEGVAPPPVIPGPRPSLFVGLDPLANSPHLGMRCVDCHPDAEVLPHPRTLGFPDCGACHEDQRTGFAEGAHGRALIDGNSLAPDCTDCHGAHGIMPPTGRDSLTHPLNIVKVCSGCHEQHTAITTNGDSPHSHIQSYLDSVHGRAVVRGGLLAAANCTDCHGYHEILPTSDPRSATHRDRIPDTCGKCHLGVEETFLGSVHGQMLIEGDPRAPVCTDCHTGHQITRSNTPGFMLDIVNECGECHDRPEMNRGRRATLYKTYRASYHGQVNKLGSTRAARCSDCHGAHDILTMDDPASRLHPDNRLETCRNCHAGASASLADFDPHADYRDRERYPLLHAVWWYFIIVISSAMGFFGLHSLLWFLRSLVERARHGKGEGQATGNGPKVYVRRFTLLNRINHAFLIIPFFGLTLTGLPLLFSDHDWALSLADALGGAIVVGVLHRVFAVILLANFIAHIIGLVLKIRAHRGSILRDWVVGPNTMLPTPRDFRDCGNMLRWFAIGGRRPRFDRWTYWEKFDYLAEIFGTFVIGGTGLMLWFPGFFASFLPGWSFNVASIVHGYEALLAVGFIFTIHFFNAHLRMEKFPVDNVIFTGSLSEQELQHERADEYDRLLETGLLDDLRVTRPPRWQRRGALVVGVVAMAIGFTIVALIILAGYQAL